MADTCNIHGPNVPTSRFIGGLGLCLCLCLGLTACTQASRFGAADERSRATGDQPPQIAATAVPLRNASQAVPAIPDAPRVVRPRPAPRSPKRRLERWVHGQIHGQQCRLPENTFSRPVGLYYEDRHPRKRVVLTFDDGPMYRRTDRILDLLRKNRQKATFFVVGSMIHGATFRTVQRMVRDGHILANHSYHHRTRMAKLKRARETIRVELLLTQAMVDIALLSKSRRQFRKLRLRLLGGEKRSRFPRAILRMWPVVAANWRAILREHGKRDGKSPYAMVYVRPPGGNPLMGRWTRAQRREYAAAAQGLGLITVLWNSASLDSTRRLPALQRKDVMQVSGSILHGAIRGGVLLMHDWMNTAHLALALQTIAASRTVRVVRLHRLVRRKLGCDAVWLSALVRAREAQHILQEQRARHAKLEARRAMDALTSRKQAPHKLRSVAAPTPAPAPPPSSPVSPPSPPSSPVSTVATSRRVL